MALQDIKHLRTVKKLSSEVGVSISFIKQLIRERKLTRFKIGKATYVSLLEFEKLAADGVSKM